MKALLAGLLLVAGAEAGPLNVFEARLEGAARRYAAEEARRLADEVAAHHAEARSREVDGLLARALLLVADLHRMEYELLPETDGPGRRALGAIIDDAATRALDILKVMDNIAETWRMRADLYGAMIRSDYRATRFRKRMDEAIAKALELDPENPRARVSAARPLIFAGPEHGQDLHAALEQLDRALALEPGLEAARMLRAVALEKLGRIDEAKAQWQALLEVNPDCVPAKRRLEEEWNQ